METVLGVWINDDQAIILERRGDGSEHTTRLEREHFQDGGREASDRYLFRILDAAHHAHRFVLLGPVAPKLWKRARRYSFLKGRIRGVWPDRGPSALSRQVDALQHPSAGSARPVTRKRVLAEVLCAVA